MMKWRRRRYQRDTTLVLLIEKHLERQAGRQAAGREGGKEDYVCLCVCVGGGGGGGGAGGFLTLG